MSKTKKIRSKIHLIKLVIHYNTEKVIIYGFLQDFGFSDIKNIWYFKFVNSNSYSMIDKRVKFYVSPNNQWDMHFNIKKPKPAILSAIFSNAIYIKRIKKTQIINNINDRQEIVDKSVPSKMDNTIMDNTVIETENTVNTTSVDSSQSETTSQSINTQEYIKQLQERIMNIGLVEGALPTQHGTVKITERPLSPEERQAMEDMNATI